MNFGRQYKSPLGYYNNDNQIDSYPYYQEYDYMKNCQQDGRSKSQCEQTWKELRALD